MNKGQEGHVGSGNVEHERSDKLKIRRVKVNQFNNRMPPKRLWELVENMNDMQKEATRQISFGGFLHLQVDMISGKLTLMRVIEHDVHMMLVLPKGSLEVVESKNESNTSVAFTRSIDGGKDFRRNFVTFVTTVTNEEEQVNEEECHNKSVEDEAIGEDRTRVSRVKALFRDGREATDLIITNSQLLVEGITKLEELIA
ncbi:hypothetical protein Cgig2_013004 [Carnegiea gigantea]|uniref:Uncharacterized protein n=1 Tax=Carnegiea gigantea TaxID=171969 RepID=A0A9Q1K9X3_9CARY|nr:hypothetical protein Cgig2_013004 [Carnegiea gigantea]